LSLLMPAIVPSFKGSVVPPAPYTIEIKSGRLIEARVFGLRTSNDVEAYAHDLGVQALRIRDRGKGVLCADHRPIVVYAQPIADRLVELFTHMNPRLERVAVLAGRTNATLVLQLERLVREAACSARRVCFTAEGARAHLAPVLDAQELARMRDFLEEHRT
jgi:hypothetical protein